jgi:integrase
MIEERYTASQGVLSLREEDTRKKGTQTGNVRFRSGAWYVRFSCWQFVDGGLKWKETEKKIEDGGRKLSKKQAEILGHQQFVSKANQTNRAPQGLSDLQTFIELQYVPAVTISYHGQWRRTVEGILRNHIIPAFGPLQMNEIRRPMVQEWINRLAGGYSGQTVKHCVNILKAIFDHAIDEYDLDFRNPAERVKLPRIEAKQKQALTMTQVRQIAAKLSGPEYERPEYGRLVILLGCTGMRIGEALGLRWRCVNFEERVLTIERSFSAGEWGPTKTTGSQRIIELTDEACSILRDQLSMTKWNGADHTVFTSQNGTPLNYGNIEKRYLKPACKDLQLGGVSWHTLRHTTATLIDKHSTGAEKRSLMGHTTTRMSDHYTHVRPGAVREALEKATKETIN